jgi:RNA chaperone Hfq
MAADKQNLQDAFLNHVRKAKVPVTIFLINGVKLQGVITWFDNFCVLLRSLSLSTSTRSRQSCRVRRSTSTRVKTDLRSAR